jgi:Na+/H+ antiporter NhaD/arsenite permease-like protein
VTPEILAILIVFTLVVVVNGFNEKLNAGILAIAGALLVGLTIGGMRATQVLNGFPTDLFVILLGVTLFFSMLNANGTMQGLAQRAVALTGGRVTMIPLYLFLMAAVISSIGAGNIGTIAMLAPPALMIAAEIRLSPFLMSLVLVGGANGATFSPVALTGIIANTIVERLGMTSVDLDAVKWQSYFFSLLAHAVVSWVGFLLLGGLRWIREARIHSAGVDRPIAAFTFPQRWSLVFLAAYIGLVVIPTLPGLSEFNVLARLNVGAVAFVLASALMVLRLADFESSLRYMPWGSIILVCGVMVLMEYFNRQGGTEWVTANLRDQGGASGIHFWIALSAAAVSAFSSSSGVVLPTFLPMVPSLVQHVASLDPAALIVNINVSSHLVDCSPLSTLGAICVASATAENRTALFRQLLAWGLAMIPVSAAIAWAVFG